MKNPKPRKGKGKAAKRQAKRETVAANSLTPAEQHSVEKAINSPTESSIDPRLTTTPSPVPAIDPMPAPIMLPPKRTIRLRIDCTEKTFFAGRPIIHIGASDPAEQAYLDQLMEVAGEFEAFVKMP